MDPVSEFDFSDGIKIVLVAIFMLGSVQLHALIDESAENQTDRTERLALQSRGASMTVPIRHDADGFDQAEAQLRNAPLPIRM